MTLKLIRQKRHTTLLAILCTVCCSSSASQPHAPTKNTVNSISQESIDKFNKAINFIISNTNDKILVKPDGTIENATLRNFFSKDKNFPLIILKKVNNRKQFLTYESCVTAPYSSYLDFLKSKNSQLDFNRAKSFKEFSIKQIGEDSKWSTICEINDRFKFAQIDKDIAWPTINSTAHSTAVGFSVSVWSWKKHKVVSMLDRSGEFISIW